jgi:hypothetical protein
MSKLVVGVAAGFTLKLLLEQRCQMIRFSPIDIISSI